MHMAVVLQTVTTGNKGEREAWRELMRLPDDFYLLRELTLNHGAANGKTDDEERRPDFVLAGVRIGLVSLEVKDWNLEDNIYTLLDQYKFLKLPDNEKVPNPWQKARTYYHDLVALTKNMVPVISLVYFPRLSRAKFVNCIADPDKLITDPQMRMAANPSLTIFEDDVRLAGGIESVLLDRVAHLHRKLNLRIEVVLKAIDKLLPAEFHISSGQRRADDLASLHVLSERQQEIALRYPVGKHLLLDIAGSGKTNVLVSRAISFARRAMKKRVPTSILLTAHSEKLCKSLQLVLDEKLSNDDVNLKRSIHVHDMRSIVRFIVAKENGFSLEELEHLYPRATESGFEELLRAFESIAPTLGEKYRKYDDIFIDEVQDYENYMKVVLNVIWRGNELFLAGDVAQHLSDHRFPLHRLGIDLENASLEPEFISYRCPAPIAEWAHLFAWSSPMLRQELLDHGYPSDLRPKLQGLNNLPESREVPNPSDVLAEVINFVEREHRRGVPLREIMIVSCRPDEVVSKLEENGLKCKREPSAEDAAISVTFDESKGLEAEFVVVIDMEHLRKTTNNPFEEVTPEQRRELDEFARCRAYVAMTRAKRNLTWVYYDRNDPLVRDLIKPYRKVMAAYAK
jgi:hypothetical protein